MRLNREEINKIMVKNDCTDTLSWSKFNTYITDLFSFYLKYIRNIKEEKSNSYALLGSVVHDNLEKFYNGTYTREQMINKFDAEMTKQSLSDVQFVANEEQNSRIENRYYNCIKHFFYNYQKASKSSVLEKFVCMKFGKYLMQGYIDHLYPKVISYTDNNGISHQKEIVVIEDFKTSTIYTGPKIEKNSGQLKLYAYMIHNTYNISFDNIQIGWNFLKYVKLTYQLKNGNIKSTNVLRDEIPQSLSAKIKTWANFYKYTPSDYNNFMDIIYKNAEKYMDNNILKGLPQEIQDKFTIEDCFVEIPYNEDVANDFIKYVSDTIEDMDAKINIYNITQDSNIFWQDVTEENSFYFTNLCNYTSKYHLPLRKYYEDKGIFNGESNNKSNNKTNNLDNDIFDMLFSSAT